MSFQHRPRFINGLENLESRIVLAADLSGLLGGVACEVVAADAEGQIKVLGETGSQLLTVREAAGNAEVWAADLNGANDTQLATTPGEVGRQSFVHGDHLYFTVKPGEGFLGTDPVQLWISDGTAAGTASIADLGVWDFLGQSVNVEFYPTGEQLVLKVSQRGIDSATSHLWVSDGTAAGTAQYSGEFTGMSDGIQSVTDMNGAWLFDGQESSNGPASYGLWATDPASETTEPIRNFESTVDELIGLGDAAFFVVSDGGDRELWITDGTTDGTSQLIDINATGSSSPRNLVAAGDTLFFTADDGTNGRELWATDGTADGTQLVADINASGSSDIAQMVAAGDSLFFTVRNSDSTIDLWISEGLTATRVAALPGRIQTFTDSFSPPASAGASLFFAVGTEDAGTELWTSDGSAAGTGIAVDANPGAASSNPYQLTAGNDRLLFAATGDSGNNGVWSVEVETDIGSLTTDLLAGDANGSGEVDFQDFLVISRNFGEAVEGGVMDGDLDENGTVEFNDFLILSANFGATLGR